MPRPLGTGNTRDIAGLKCRDLTHEVSPQCLGSGEVCISRLDRPLLKEFVSRAPKYQPIYMSIQPKGVQPGGFVAQFACSWAGADPEMIVLRLGWGEV